MSYEQLVTQIKLLESPDCQVKNAAFQQLYQIENDTQTLLLFPQLLQSNDQNLVFYGLKFAENLTLKTNPHIQTLIPQLLTFLQQIIFSQAPYYLRQKSSQLLFTLSFFNLVNFTEILTFFVTQTDDTLVSFSAQSLSALSASLLQLHQKGVPSIVLRNYRNQLLEFFNSQHFVTFSQQINSENSAKSIGSLLVFVGKSQPLVLEFVFKYMTFCQPSQIFQPGNIEFFTVQLKIANNVFQGMKKVQLEQNLIVNLNQFFYIIGLLCDEIKGNSNFENNLVSEITILMRTCVFSQFFGQFFSFTLEKQIHKTLMVDPNILYKQRGVEKMKTTIYSSMCKMIEAIGVFYMKGYETNDINLIINLLEAVLQIMNVQCDKTQKKYLLEMYKDTFIELIDLIIMSIQRPQEVVYFKNEFGEVIREKISESHLIHLNTLQLSVLTAIIGNFSLQSQYFEKLSVITQKQDISYLQQLTYVYPAYADSVSQKYVKNNTQKIKFLTQAMQLFLTISDALQHQNDKLLAFYCTIYVASKSITQVSTQLKLSFVIKAFGYISAGIPDITEASVQLLIAIFNSLNMKEIQAQSEFFEREILFPVFEISMKCLDQYQIKELYENITRVVKIDSQLGILLFPIQNFFTEIVANLNVKCSDELFSEANIVQVLNIFQIIQACSVNINSLELDQFIEPIYEQIRIIWNFYWQNQSKCPILVQSLIRSVYLVLKQLILTIEKSVFKSKYDGFIEYIIAQESIRLKQFCETQQPLGIELIQFLDLLTTKYLAFDLFKLCFQQIQKIDTIEEVKNTFWIVFQNFFENGAVVYNSLTQEQKLEFQSIFVEISTKQEFQTSYSQQLLIRFADQINYCILRRSGQQFISYYLLQLIKTGFIAPEQFILNVFEQAKGILGFDVIQNILTENMHSYFQEVLQDVLSGSEEGVRDLRLLSH